MITEKTVLILGAGASVDYGYPLGRALIISIYENLAEGRALYKQLLQCNFQPQLIKQFGTDLKECNLPSIDAFLENRNEFEKIGKAAIAATLIRHEGLEYLSRQGWYEYLHSRLIGRKEEFQANKLAVVTFNYDRSFEASLFLALQKSYNLTDSECAKYVNMIPIIHVYGQLGELPHLSENGRHYSPLVDQGVIHQSVRGIKIVHEGAGDTLEFQRAQEAISQVKIVCCLGFGFHPENVKRLNLSQTLQGSPRKKVYLSAYDLTQRQTEKLKARIFPDGISGSIHIEFGRHDHNVLDFLRETAALE